MSVVIAVGVYLLVKDDKNDNRKMAALMEQRVAYLAGESLAFRRTKGQFPSFESRQDFLLTVTYSYRKAGWCPA